MSFFRDPAEEFRTVPPLDAIWTRQLGRGTAGPTPSDLYEPPVERIAELRAMPYQDYLQTGEWHERRRITLLEQGRSCQRCGALEPLDIHHRTYENLGCELPEDLEVLCRRCHQDEHGAAT